ncbi:hypothetical protein [Niveibacterium sp.]|uniref:hypothetical protein n=1 Tax=Niveibacterium sp. TaxID=2017444 RepID=UPI0035B1DBAB
MFAIASFFGRRNETLVRSCQPAMYSTSAGFTRAAEVRFDVLERRRVVAVKAVEEKRAIKANRTVSRKRASVAQCGTVANDLYDDSPSVDQDEDSFFMYDRLDFDVMNPIGDIMMD